MFYSHEGIRKKWRVSRCCPRCHRRSGKRQYARRSQFRRKNKSQTALVQPEQRHFAASHPQNLRQLQASSIRTRGFREHALQIAEGGLGGPDCGTLVASGCHNCGHSPYSSILRASATSRQVTRVQKCGNGRRAVGINKLLKSGVGGFAFFEGLWVAGLSLR
jgi:hypothetical protein